MIKNLIISCAIILFFITNSNAQMSESGSLGIGLQWTSLNYGVSAKYNFTETHSGQVIVGSADYGYGSIYGDDSGFSFTARYLYNFEEGDIDFATFKPYLYGQAGYWTYKYNIAGFEYSFDAIVFGAGGGIEWSINNFVDGLAFNFELGFTSISFDGLGSVGGFNGGAGIHYYF